MTKKIDLGEDKNYFVSDLKEKEKAQLSTSLLIEDLARSSYDAIKEAKQAAQFKWLNSEPLLMAYVEEDSGTANLFSLDSELKKQVLLLEFMDLNVLHCRRSLRYISEINRRYQPAGLLTIGIHSPMFNFGKDDKTVKDAVNFLGINFPVVMDNDFAFWKSLENRYWPRRVLINRNYELYQDYVGEGEYEALEQDIQNLLRQISPGLACPPLLKTIYQPKEEGFESFFGMSRGVGVGNKEEIEVDNRFGTYFKDKGDYPLGKAVLDGPWYVDDQSLYPAIGSQKDPYEEDYKFTIRFKAKNVYMVACSRAKNPGNIPQAVRFFAQLDGKPIRDDFIGRDMTMNESRKTTVQIKNPHMYHILKNVDPGPHELSFIINWEASEIPEFFAFFFEA